MAYKKDKVVDFVEERKYTDIELNDFHNKIQRFWGEPREVNLPNGFSGTARGFNHEELAVAFGAARKVQQGSKPDGSLHFYYLYNPDRYRVLLNLWKQYESWLQKKDWIENKENAQLEQIAEQVPF